MSKDLFSKQASLYAKYRPRYPKELIEYILSSVQSREIAWDCATGNGQAALLLAPYFKKTFATDISEKQINEAVRHPSITYSVNNAEKTSFADNTFDLITVAQAYHWFRFDDFFEEATRVGKQRATVAVWGYGLLIASDKYLNKMIRDYYSQKMGKYWDPERKYIDEEYKTVPFHFANPVSKDFHENVEWTLDDLTGFFNTWSSLQHFIKANNYNAANEFAEELKLIWNDGSKKSFSFPLFLRMGKIEK